MLTRSDIRADPGTGMAEPGALFELTFRVGSIIGGVCALLPNALVDVWECNALGQYSDTLGPGYDTRGQKWLRGNQRTDAGGTASFTGIYPGWYAGRNTHLHFKIRTLASVGAAVDFTSQLFFDDILSDMVGAQAPYSAHMGKRLANNADPQFKQALLLNVVPTAKGYAAIFTIALMLG
jgi:protocatechuate 3,4-dioxygenase beta subunit